MEAPSVGLVKVKLRGPGKSPRKGLVMVVCPPFASSLAVVNIERGAGGMVDAIRTLQDVW